MLLCYYLRPLRAVLIACDWLRVATVSEVLKCMNETAHVKWFPPHIWDNGSRLDQIRGQKKTKKKYLPGCYMALYRYYNTCKVPGCYMALYRCYNTSSIDVCFKISPNGISVIAM